MLRKIFKITLILSFILGLLATACAAVVGMYFYIRLTRDLPQIERLSDYRPPSVSSVYAADGTLIAELFEERRYPVPLKDIPPLVRNAFLAAEDSNFYQHPGIDFISILRAVYVNLKNKTTRQGASTITQQVVKSLLLTREKTYERKAKEAILSYRLERALSKDDIFNIYLNEIFLGSGAYGVRAAAKVHFHKELNELELAEVAFLAALPQKPSRLADPNNRREALGRQRYVLEQMRKNNMISEEEYRQALKKELKIFPPDDTTIYGVPYFATHAKKVAEEILLSLNNTWTPGNPGGFSIYTTVDVKAYDAARRALQRALRELDKRQGWRGPINRRAQGISEAPRLKKISTPSELQAEEVYVAIVDKVNLQNGTAIVHVDEVVGAVDLRAAGWARKYVKGLGQTSSIVPERVIARGDLIEVSLLEESKQEKKPENGVLLKLDQTPEVEGALVLLNALTGELRAVIGGYDYTRSNFNRATQGLLQPGSAFKPIIYLAAVEELNYTASTIVPDSPISLPSGDGVWSPQNYDGRFYGPMTLRSALERSRNVVSVHLLYRLGVDRGIQSARKLGITTPIPRNMSIALGTPELHLLELARAYGVFAAEGYLAETIVVKAIKDRDGKTIYEQTPRQTKVISAEDAFVMANIMRGVVERGTATRVKALNRPVAGKTGTTNNEMDAWFIGYTPEWVAGVWVGFDVKRKLGDKETGGKTAAPAFIYLMEEFLRDVPPLDFSIPDGVIPVAVNLQSGRPVDPESEGAFIEYFKSGSEPRGGGPEIEVPKDYLENDEF